jgi:hypothetical protein
MSNPIFELLVYYHGSLSGHRMTTGPYQQIFLTINPYPYIRDFSSIPAASFINVFKVARIGKEISSTIFILSILPFPAYIAAGHIYHQRSIGQTMYVWLLCLLYPPECACYYMKHYNKEKNQNVY